MRMMDMHFQVCEWRGDEHPHVESILSGIRKKQIEKSVCTMLEVRRDHNDVKKMHILPQSPKGSANVHTQVVSGRKEGQEWVYSFVYFSVFPVFSIVKSGLLRTVCCCIDSSRNVFLHCTGHAGFFTTPVSPRRPRSASLLCTTLGSITGHFHGMSSRPSTLSLS